MRIHDFINKYNYEGIYEVIPSSLDGNKTTPIIIGITGSYGKSSCAQMLYQYLEYLGYIVAIYSSSKLNCPGTVYDSDQTQNDTIADATQLSYILDAASQWGVQYIILECQETAIARGVYDDLTFDYKVLTGFKQKYNVHWSEDAYLQTKLHFFDNVTPTILNGESVFIDKFLEVAPQAELFGVGSVGLTDYTSTLASMPKTPFIYPIFKIGGLGHSYVEYQHNDHIHKTSTTLSMEVGTKMLLTFLAIVHKMNIASDSVVLQEFLDNAIVSEGRYDDFQWNGRTFIIDVGSSARINEFLEELNAPELANAQEKYKEMYGSYFETETFSNIRATLCTMGLFSDKRWDIYKKTRDPKFKYINPGKNSNDNRKHFLVFGGNLLKLKNRWADFPTVSPEPTLNNLYSAIIDEVGADSFVDFSNYTGDLTISYLENLYDRLANYAYEIEKTKPFTFYYNFAWRSPSSLKAFFGFNTSDLHTLITYFKTLNNQNLTDACNYIENIIAKTDYEYVKNIQPANDMAQILPIKKYYLTTIMGYQPADQFELDKLASKISNTPHAKYMDRRDALKAIVDESEPGDLILILGRGSRKPYFPNNEFGVSFSDKEYILDYISSK